MKGLSAVEVLALVDAFTQGKIHEVQLIEALKVDADIESDTIDVEYHVIDDKQLQIER